MTQPAPTNQAISIRPAVPADVTYVIAFNRAMAEETEGLHLDDAVLAAGVREALADPLRCRYFVAEINGAIVGQTMFTTEWSDWRNGFFWWIQSVYVAPNHRRRGVFRALYDHVRTLARAQPDVVGIRLYVHNDNARAIRTYGQLGMTTTAYRICEEDWSGEVEKL